VVFLLLAAASAVLLAALAVLLWLRRPPAALWPIVFFCQIFALLWVVGDLWATNARSVAEKQVAFVVLFSGSLPLAAAWWVTARRYVVAHGLGQAWMASRWTALPVWFAGATWLLAVSNAWHGQFLTPVVDAANDYHWGIMLAFGGNYSLALATVTLCTWAAGRHPSPDVRRRMTILALATLAPVVANIVHLNLPGWPREDPTALGLGLSSAAILYGVFRERLFSPLPVAVEEILRRDPAGLLVLDRGGRLLTWNPAAAVLLEGLSLEPDLRMVHELARRLERRDGERLRSSRALTERLTEETEERRVFRDAGAGEERWLEISLLPLPSRSGRLAAVCLRLVDVTALERAERERQALAEQVRHVEKLESLGLLAGGVAHDFNNLLTVINGQAELALQELPASSAGREQIEEVRGAAAVAIDLTRQLLAYAGRASVRREAVELSPLVEDLLRLLSSTLPPKVALHTHLSRDLPVIDGDPAQMRQLVLSLVTNGAEAIGDEEGYVTVRTGRERRSPERLRRDGLQHPLEAGEHVFLEVADSGCGMDEETRRHIYDPFFSTKVRGRGLGLAAVYGIVRSHRAAIAVRSEPGSGTTFRVWFPAREGATRPSAPALPEVRGWRGSGTVLLVDDQERVRRLAATVLERAGFRVLTAADGGEAATRFREHMLEIRLVILDLTMPERGGEEALREIRSADPEARVILTSGFDESDVMSRLSAEKIGGFLHKPWQPAELLAKVRAALVAEAGP
jgi:PAS domain S-box-containing protein